jgi:hypothetical protein
MGVRDCLKGAGGAVRTRDTSPCQTPAEVWQERCTFRRNCVGPKARYSARLTRPAPGPQPDWMTLLTTREFERSYPGAPIESPVGLLILVRVPERAVVNRVHADTAVIAPAIQSR